MTHNTNPHHRARTQPADTFSAKNYRDAMGPGYSVSLYKEQRELTGQPRSAPTTEAAPAAQAVPPLHWSMWMRWAKARRYVANSIAVVASRRRICPTSMMRHHC